MHPAHVAGTNPYPWPYDGCFEATRCAFLICGAQRQLMAVSTDVVRVRQRLGLVADRLRACGGAVLWIRHGTRIAGPGPSRLLPVRDTTGWQLVDDTSLDDVVDATGWDGCFGSGLDHVLRSGGRRTVVLGGFASEVTVDSTVRTLNDQGHECLVLTDGCAPLDRTLGARAHSSVTMSGGIFGALGTSAALLELLSIQPSTQSNTHSSTRSSAASDEAGAVPKETSA
ncbi:MAG TPA: isochorismatase family protein [Ilumatobacteraceae bacterium]